MEWLALVATFQLILHSHHLFRNFENLTEVKVVAVFDAMLSGLPTHKETFAGYVLLKLNWFCSFY